MDPLSAIGLAAAVVQFVEFGFRVASRLEEFNSKSSGEVPKSLLAISTQLPLLLNALGRIKTDSQIKKLDFDTKCILRGMISGCQAQIVEIEGMINDISKAPGDSLKTKIKKVFISFKYDEKVWEVERNLHTYSEDCRGQIEKAVLILAVSVLILHHVIDSTDVPFPPVEDAFFDVREKKVVPFIERPKLMEALDDHFHDAARSQTTNPTIVFLAGDKGAGKTELALEFCYQSHELKRFRSVFWLDASSLENLYLGFEGMYATIKRATDGSRKEKVAFVTGFLNDLWHPWLLVLDNYNTAALYDHIMEILPSRGYGGIILITQGRAESGLGKVLKVPKFLAPQEQQKLDAVLAQEVQRKDVEGIARAVEQGADVNALIWNEWPVLHRAALFGLESSVALFLEKGALINPPVQLRPPLYWAASGSHASVALLLLDYEDKSGKSSNPADDQAAFNEAAENGGLPIMRLISSRRDVKMNIKNQYDRTPLETAAQKGHGEVVRFLLDGNTLFEDHAQGDKALLAAAAAGHLEVVKVLCAEGKVNPNAKLNGESALNRAARLEDEATRKENGLEMAKFLLEKGADPNPAGDADTPLHDACVHDHVQMIALLLEHGADPLRDNGWSSLTNAIRYKNPETIKVLLAADIKDAEARRVWIEGALRYACRTGDRNIVLQLLKAGADVNAIEVKGSPKGASPLLLAIVQGHPKTAQLLIRQGARQDLPDELGRLALPLAVEKGFELVVRDLVKAGGDANMASGEDEDTPLILAAAMGYEKVVKVLLDAGADKELTNKFGDMALDVAEEKKHKEVIKLLE